MKQCGKTIRHGPQDLKEKRTTQIETTNKNADTRIEGVHILKLVRMQSDGRALELSAGAGFLRPF